ncbi:MAG: alkaline phosphatase D family protein [Herpetosiphonaceae bacterium]|nr:alkaline phosphatase D family protein [Herpetosiphonaceae bacterium]
MRMRFWLVILLCLVTASATLAASEGDRRSLVPAAPLPNQVASGDTTATSTVLWARSPVVGTLTFLVSPNISNTLITVAGTTVTDPLVPITISLTNLTPATQYNYEAYDSAGNRSFGKFRTAPAAGVAAGLRFGASGDWRGDLSPYPAVSNADQRDLDFFVALGDTTYADYESPVLPGVAAASTLDEYRLKHTEVYSPRLGLNTLGDLRSATSLLATIDDHEVLNDFAGGAPSSSDDRFPAGFDFINDTPRYENGLQAFQEFNPLRDERYGALADPRMAGERKLYRFNTYGGSAATFLLDARSFRDAELPPVSDPTSPTLVLAYQTAAFSPTRTMLGGQQLIDLQQDLLAADRAGVVWKFVLVPEPIQNFGVVGASDRFEGYAAERTALLKFINEHNIRNVVFVAADIHGTVVNNLTYQLGPGLPQIPTDAFEITTGAVAFDKPLGPTLADLALQAGVITPQEYQIYQLLSRDQKDAFMKQALDNQLIEQGYSPIGLADGLVDETLVIGSYFAAHTYGWTEFELSPTTRQLTVTTYGINWYSKADLANNPAGVIARTPTVVSRFTVLPKALQTYVFVPLVLR